MNGICNGMLVFLEVIWIRTCFLTLCLSLSLSLSLSLFFSLFLHLPGPFLQGFVWGINSFDQWGVELGKALAKNVRSNISASRYVHPCGIPCLHPPHSTPRAVPSRWYPGNCLLLLSIVFPAQYLTYSMSVLVNVVSLPFCVLAGRAKRLSRVSTHPRATLLTTFWPSQADLSSAAPRNGTGEDGQDTRITYKTIKRVPTKVTLHVGKKYFFGGAV